MLNTLLLLLVTGADPLPTYHKEPTAALPVEQMIEKPNLSDPSAERAQRWAEGFGRPFAEMLHLRERTKEEREQSNKMAAIVAGGPGLLHLSGHAGIGHFAIGVAEMLVLIDKSLSFARLSQPKP